MNEQKRLCFIGKVIQFAFSIFDYFDRCQNGTCSHVVREDVPDPICAVGYLAKIHVENGNANALRNVRVSPTACIGVPPDEPNIVACQGAENTGIGHCEPFRQSESITYPAWMLGKPM